MKAQFKSKFEEALNEVPEGKKEIALNLIEEITFLESQLERLRPKVEESTLIEEWNNGKQKNDRVSPAVKLYLDTISKYKGFLGDLSALIPKSKEIVEEADDFMKFINKGK